MEQAKENIIFQADESGNVLILERCKCGRGPKRPKQFNCHACNREANRRYWDRVKRELEAFKRMAARAQAIV